MTTTPSSAAVDPLIGRKLGPFEVVARLGAGGMGVVYRATDTRLGRDVALKVLPTDVVGDQERRLRFLREARAAAAIGHPAIAEVFDIGEDAGDIYIAMQLCAGGSLRERLQRSRPSLGEALRIAEAIADAVAAAHRAGVVHRDLKPDNVMFDAHGHVKVLDFGLARIDAPQDVDAETVEDFQTGAGRILGTPGYMSPEQATGRAVDGRTDQFAIGVMLYELVSGVRPFRGRSSMEIIIATTRDAHAPVTTHVADVPDAVQAVIERCLAKAPADRFVDAVALRDALAAAAVMGAAVELDPVNRDSAPTGAHVFARTELDAGLKARRSELTQTATRGGTRPTRATGLLIAGIGGALAIAAAAAVMLGEQDAQNLPRTMTPPASSDDARASWGPPMWPGWPPAPRTDSPRAAELFAQGVQDFRSGRYERLSAFIDAGKLDPALAAARVHTIFAFFATGRLEDARRAYKEADAHRGAMHPVRAAILDAAEPTVMRDPPDLAEAERRLRTAMVRWPTMAIIPFAIAELLPALGRHAEVPDLAKRAVSLDPEFVPARASTVHALLSLGRLDDALTAANECRKHASFAIACTLAAVEINSQRGACAEVVALGRAAAASDPDQVAAPLFMARGIAAQDKPIAAVTALVERAFKLGDRTGLSERVRSVFRYRLAALEGRLDIAIDLARTMVAASANEVGRIQVGGPVALLAAAQLEAGQTQQAVATARGFLDRMDAYPPHPDTDVELLMGDPVPRLLAVLAQAGALDNARWHAATAAWMQQRQRTHATHEQRRYLWPVGYARAVAGPAEATVAIAELDPKLALPNYLPDPLLAADIGRTMLHAGRLDDATRWLKRAVASCDVLARPIEHARALADLGDAYARAGRKNNACAAWDRLLRRWSHPQPASVTAQRVRARAQQLGCGPPTVKGIPTL